MRILAALLAAALVLICVEVVRRHDPPRIADPCLQRTLPAAHGVDATAQQIVLAGLDHAACRLHTSREALVLSIAGSSAGGGPRLTKTTVTTTVREGLVGSLDEAARRGAVPALVVPALKRIIRAAPIEVVVSGGFALFG